MVGKKEELEDTRKRGEVQWSKERARTVTLNKSELNG